MQKTLRLVLFTGLGLILFLSPTNGWAEVLWQDLGCTDFNFTGYDKVFLLVRLDNKISNDEFVSIFNRSLEEKGVLNKVDDESHEFDLMRQSRLWLYIFLIPTKNPDVFLFRFKAKVNGNFSPNKESSICTVWEKEAILSEMPLKIKEEVSRVLNSTLNAFFLKYFSTFHGNNKAMFYYSP